MEYYSPKDESAFFNWLQSIPGVTSVKGVGTELHITLRSKKLSANTENELSALYERYNGNISELEQFIKLGSGK